jgi:hypothetical protein
MRGLGIHLFKSGQRRSQRNCARRLRRIRTLRQSQQTRRLKMRSGVDPTRCAYHADCRSSRGQASCGEHEGVRSRNTQLRVDPDRGRFSLPCARQRARRRIAPTTHDRAVSARNACVRYAAIPAYSSAKRKSIYSQPGLPRAAILIDEVVIRLVLGIRSIFIARSRFKNFLKAMDSSSRTPARTEACERDELVPI